MQGLKLIHVSKRGHWNTDLSSWALLASDLTKYMVTSCLNLLTPCPLRDVNMTSNVQIEKTQLGDWYLEYSSKHFPWKNARSALIQIMAWYHQATSHYQRKCWPISPTPYGITRSQWVDMFCKNTITLQWRHNGHDGVSNHQPHDCLLKLLFRRRSKKISKLCVTGLCEGNSPVTCEFPTQRASHTENVSIWWLHHDINFFNFFNKIQINTKLRL